MKVGSCGDVAVDPSCFQDGGRSEFHGPLRGFLLVPGDIPAAGDLIAACQGVDAGAEGGAFLRSEPLVSFMRTPALMATSSPAATT